MTEPRDVMREDARTREQVRRTSVAQADCYACKAGDACVNHPAPTTPIKREAVNHPSHYGGDTEFEHVKVAEALGWTGNAFIYNCTKYLWRFGLKSPLTALEDLKKARWYLDREIRRQQALDAQSVAEAMIPPNCP